MSGGTASAHPPARVVVDTVRLHTRVAEIALEVRSAIHGSLVVVSVLKGSLIFLADLVRSMPGPVAVDFMAVSSYAQGTGRVRLVKDLDVDIHGREVLLVEDLVDTGLTLAYLLGELERRGPASLTVCTLLDKPARRIVPVELAHVGFEVPDEFVVGYGLDYAGRYRNLDFIAAGDMAVLAEDPDAYRAQLYGIPSHEREG